MGVALVPQPSPTQSRKVDARAANSSSGLNWRLVLALSLNLVAWVGLNALVASVL